jgi:nuclear mRNA export protein SAC3
MKVSKLAVEELDIGHAFKERQARKQRSWSRLNVSELSGPILNENNPDARCLCWMLLVLVPPGMESQTNSFVSKWLLRKLMGYGIGYIGLVVSSAGLSIWTEWISFPNACCLSVVRASDQQVIDNDIANSTSCIVFVVSESISWEMQKERFNSLLAYIPDESNLPLLIFSGDTYNEGYEYASKYIINRLATPSDLVAMAHARGLQVHPYTYRNENKFLHFDFRHDPYAEYDYWINDVGIDGLFTDFPASLRRFQEWTAKNKD